MVYQMQRWDTLDKIGRTLGLEGIEGLSNAARTNIPQLIESVEGDFLQAYKGMPPQDVPPFEEHALDYFSRMLRERGYPTQA